MGLRSSWHSSLWTGEEFSEPAWTQWTISTVFAKVRVAGSNPVFRSRKRRLLAGPT